MAIKQCPRCGAEFGLSAARCPDCDEVLVERLAGDVGPEGTAGAPTIGATIDRRFADVGGASETLDRTSARGPDPIDPATRHDVDDADDGSDDADDGSDDADGDDDGEHVTYEMGEWSSEARVMLEQLLTGAGVTRVWEGTDLVVRSVDEDTVDTLVEEVRSTDEPMLDPDAEKVVYEVNDWTTEQLVTLTDGLVERGIGYQFDVEGDLVVLATDEDGVEKLLDIIEFGPGDGSDGDDDDGSASNGRDPDDGLETAEILSELFVACDKLQKNARDADAVLGVVGTAERLSGRALPFGYEPAVWDGLVGAAGSLRDDLEGDDVTDEDLETKARSLRDRLREYV